MVYQVDNVAELAAAGMNSPPGRHRILKTVCRAHGAFRDVADRRYHFSLVCLIPPGDDPSHTASDDIAVILRELDTSDPEEYLITVAELDQAQSIGEMAWRIPALGWDLVFYRHIPIAHTGS